VRRLHQVLSFGDLILAFGVGNLVFRLLKPIAPLRRRGRDKVLGVLPGPTAARPPTELSPTG
jgi:hypothetical protein